MSQSLTVIPGRAKREPGIQGRYAGCSGFRVPAFGRPRNDRRETN
jgi:hypothetical protein